MTFKLGMMHLPKPVDRATKFASSRSLPPAASGVVESPVEFLIRIRESQRRARPDWKGAMAQ